MNSHANPLIALYQWVEIFSRPLLRIKRIWGKREEIYVINIVTSEVIDEKTPMAFSFCSYFDVY
jgi:hypothetical protein